MSPISAPIFNVQHFSTEDGPGIRTTVFVKGCPLRCSWCANPESQLPQRQVAHRQAICIGCGACVAACPVSALSASASGITVDRSKCRSCGTCTKVCPSGAMFFYGQTRTLEDVFAEVLRDSDYYRQSGGGLTVSGGECMTRPEFVLALFDLCRAQDIHTALDTCGYFDPALVDRLKDNTDLVLYDLKFMDSSKHLAYTGVDNTRILQNLRHMVDLGMHVVIRRPLIPGINDSREELCATARFIQSLNPGLHVDLLPYHRFGKSKYAMLNMDYAMGELLPPDGEQKSACKAVFDSFGLDCTVH